MRVLCVGISHKTADLAIREKLALDEQASRSALLALRGRYNQAEFVILGTCNRSEIYCARPVHGHPREQELAELLGSLRGVPLTAYAGCVYSFTDDSAVRHLLRVAGGLDSLVLGESQILGQVRSALALAGETGSTGPVLSQLFQLAVHAAKHIQSETALAGGRTSVAAVAVDVIAREAADLSSATVLNVGAGKMNVLMLRRLAELGCRSFSVLNRSAEKAAELARECSGRPGSLAELPERLAEADVVVTSTAAAEPIITQAMLQQAQRRRAGKSMLIVDIAVPRDVEPSAGAVEGVRLYNIDDLNRVVQSSQGQRWNELGKCAAIIDEHAGQFAQWLAGREVAPTIRALRQKIRAIAEQELASAGRKLAGHADVEEDQAILHRLAHRLVQRILHEPTANLRKHGDNQTARMHAAALRKLFDLDEE